MTTKKKTKTPKAKRPPKAEPIHGGLITLRRGDARKVLAGEMVDAVISDPPYSASTHEGSNRGGNGNDGAARHFLNYGHLTPRDIRAFCRSWHPRTRGWIAVMSDDVLVPIWKRELEAVGRYVFAGLPVIIPGMQFRPTGDGPAREGVYLTVARWRTEGGHKWRSTPGWYKATRDGFSDAQGGKPLALMESIIRDYSNPGDVVCDPFAGHGTTLFAAARMGRYGLGAERDDATWREAEERLRAAYTPSLFDLHARRANPSAPTPEQTAIDLIASLKDDHEVRSSEVANPSAEDDLDDDAHARGCRA